MQHLPASEQPQLGEDRDPEVPPQLCTQHGWRRIRATASAPRRLKKVTTAAVLAAVPFALIGTTGAHAQVPASTPISWQTTPNSEVTVNLTVDNPAAAGWLAAYPCADGFQGTSNVNYVAGQTTSTAAVVRSDAAGMVCVKTMAPTEIIVDQFEVRPAAAGLNVGSPARVLDTRSTGQRGQAWALTLGAPNDVALFNLTAVRPDGPGFLTAWPCDQPMPTASNVNYVAGDPAVPNFVEAKTSAAGQVCIHSHATTDIIVDKVGAGSNPTITAHTPVRVIDSRNDGGSLRPGAPRSFHAAAGRSIVSFNLTVTDGAGPGWVKAWPCDQPEPSTSNINFVAGEIKANFVKVLTSASGDVCLAAMTPVNVIVDQVAEDTATQFGTAPTRVYDSRTIAPPAPAPAPAPPAPPTTAVPRGRVAPNPDGSCPDNAPIKGNANSGIYHRPGQQYYTRTNAEDCFATPAAAEAAGYRAAKL